MIETALRHALQTLRGKLRDARAVPTPQSFIELPIASPGSITVRE